ncbi:hypothetical protein MBANPS3_007683 [Mucor bainieri]
MSFLYTTPDESFGTIAEANGSLVHVESENGPGVREIQASNMPLYPSIQFESLAPPEADFVSSPPAQDSFYVSGFNDIKSQFVKQVEEALPLIKSSPVYKHGKDVYEYVNNRFLKAHDTLLQHEIFQAKRDAGLFKGIAWHHHLDMLAVAHDDNQVYIYDKTQTGDAWTCLVLSHPRMTQITCLEWKAKASGTLAVGCKDGVCVWTLEPTSCADQQPRFHPAATMRFLSHPGEEDISSLAWDPTPGSHLLAAVSAVSSTLVIYDVLLNRTTPLKRLGSGNIIVRWSPDGEWLFQGGSSSNGSRVWDTRTWTYHNMTNPAGLWIQTACWLPDSRTLLYSMCGKSDIHAVHLSGDIAKTGIINRHLFSATANTVTTDSGAAQQVGGVIRDMSIDKRHGQRLAIVFENTHLIALYSVKQVSLLSLLEEPMLFPIGYVRGCNVSLDGGSVLSIASLPASTKPLSLSFSSTYKDGALLAVTWSTGLITFVTHTFLTDEEIKKRFM